MIKFQETTKIMASVLRNLMVWNSIPLSKCLPECLVFQIFKWPWSACIKKNIIPLEVVKKISVPNNPVPKVVHLLQRRWSVAQTRVHGHKNAAAKVEWDIPARATWMGEFVWGAHKKDKQNIFKGGKWCWLFMILLKPLSKFLLSFSSSQTLETPLQPPAGPSVQAGRLQNLAPLFKASSKIVYLPKSFRRGPLQHFLNPVYIATFPGSPGPGPRRWSAPCAARWPSGCS